MRAMSGSDRRKSLKRKISVESDYGQMLCSNVANAYGVRYGRNASNASRHRLSRSATRGLATVNGTVSFTRRGFSLHLSSGARQNAENFQDALYQKWSIYSSSAFSCFESSPEKLHHYAQKFNKILSVKLRKPHCNEIFYSEFKYSPGCPSLLSIDIFSSNELKRGTKSNINKQSDDGDSEKFVYAAKFFAWDDKKSTPEEDENNYEIKTTLNMPLLLCRSPNGSAFIENVNGCLEGLFDMVIVKTILSQEDMSWLVCLASSDLNDHISNPTGQPAAHFFYDLPRASLLSCQPHIAISYEVSLIDQIWKCVHEENGAQNEILHEEVLICVRSLEEHCRSTYRLNLSECCLVKIVIPTASISIDGMIKITSVTVAGRILRFLADKCALGSSLVPSLGFSMTL